MNIYYWYPLPLHYHSGQTIQVIQDYKSLTALGHRIFLYGTYENEDSLADIYKDIAGYPIRILSRKGHSSWNRNLLKWQMLFHILKDSRDKVIVSRNVNKMGEAVAWKPLLRRTRFLWERHEDAIPHLLGNKTLERASVEKQRMAKLLRKIDGLLLTNFSQTPLFEQEFGHLPPHAVLPNGVDISLFSQVEKRSPEAPFILTYTGQFTRWKNVELLFQALTHLDKRYHLRIAGGKGDEASQRWMNELIGKYGLHNRVDYVGFVPREHLPSRVLSGSAALLLPLGDNLESRYFTSPMKLFEYMATPIPVVAVDYPSVRGITGENSVYLSSDNSKAFAKTIEFAMTDSLQAKRVHTMNALAQQFSYENRAKQLHLFLTSLGGFP